MAAHPAGAAGGTAAGTAPRGGGFCIVSVLRSEGVGKSRAPVRPETRTQLLIELARAFGGAVIFALPLLMTMEMWQLGYAMDPLRLALLLLLGVPLLLGLSHFGGLRPNRRFVDNLADALTTMLVAVIAAVAVLLVLGLVDPGMSVREMVGMVALQVVPGAIGAALARSQLSGDADPEEPDFDPPSYPGELFIMAAGALFLALNVAPTEEVALIAFRMSVWNQLGLMAFSLAIMHAFVYGLGFTGTEATHEDDRPVGIFLRFTLVGYVLVLAMSLYILWTFGRLDGLSPHQVTGTTIVLAFPGAIGAAAARLIL